MALGAIEMPATNSSRQTILPGRMRSSGISMLWRHFPRQEYQEKEKSERGNQHADQDQNPSTVARSLRFRRRSGVRDAVIAAGHLADRTRNGRIEKIRAAFLTRPHS